MEVLGEGSYGCVVRPPLECESKSKQISNSDSSVSKLFVNKDEFQREVKAAKKVAKIDPEGNSILTPSKYCKTSLEKVRNTNAVWSCETIHEIALMTKKTPVYQLLMPYGGTRLDHFVKSTTLRKKTFVSLMMPVFDGVAKLAKKKYCHQDIKSSNILVRPDGHAIIIDYSLMKKFKEIYAPSNMRRLRHTYYPYPPEYKVLHGLHSMKTDKEIVDDVKKNANHYNSKYGEVLIESWGGDKGIAAFIAKMRSIPEPEKWLAKLADRIDVYSVGAVFVQFGSKLSNSGLSTGFKKIYDELVVKMTMLDPELRISPSALLDKMEVLKNI